MPTPHEEQAEGIAEASRLLREGLELLEERRREVDAMLEEARERALNITAEAEARAAQIMADAERQRTELEEQAAALRVEIAALREELAAAKPPEPPPASSADLEPELATPPLPVLEAAEAAGTPRWGRRSTLATAQQQAVRASKRRWLPWLPFTLMLGMP